MTSDELQWIFRGSTWALCRADPLRFGQTIVQYIRWSESADQYVDMYGASLGKDLDAAKQQVEVTMTARPPAEQEGKGPR